MLYTQNSYMLLGKKPRSVLKTITEKKNGKNHTHLEKVIETICYFSYQSEDVDGAETITLYVIDRVIKYDELQVGETYYIPFGNSIIDFIISSKEYYDVLYRDLESNKTL